MTLPPPEPNEQDPSGSQNVHQNVGTNESNVQGVSAGDNAYVTQGNNSPIIIQNQPSKVSETRLTPQEYRNRQALLNKVNQFWVKGVLEKSLHDQVLIELDWEERPDAVADRWNQGKEILKERRKQLVPGTKIIQFFDQLGQGRTMLILGQAGSGKTFSLLELTRDLVARAEQDPEHLLPVVFDLSFWAGEKQKMEDWLVEELNSKYQVPKKIGRVLVKENKLLLLLDSLDEIRAEYREQFIKAVNEFTQVDSEIVVCSRIKDYEKLSNCFNFQNAVYSRPLTPEKIRDYLDRLGSDWEGLRTLMKKDRALKELSESPLMLNIMTLVYQGVAVEEVPKTDLVEERRQQLLDAYVKKMFMRQGANQRYSKEQTICWITWLAQRMSEHQSLFLIEEIQPSWLLTNRGRWGYIFLSRLIGGLIFVTPFSVIRIIEPTDLPVLFPTLLSAFLSSLCLSFIDGWGLQKRQQTLSGDLSKTPDWRHLASSLIVTEFIFGLVCYLTIKHELNLVMGLPFGIFFGLLFGLRGMRRKMTSDIKTFEILNWSWKDSIRWVIIAIIIANIFAFPLKFLFPEKYATLFTLMITLISGATGTVFGGLRGENIETERKFVTNQGIKFSCKTAILGAIIGGLVGAIVGILRRKNPAYAMQTFVTLGMSQGALWYGGLDVIQHFILRLILWGNKFIPWNYARFLDYATKLIFLKKVGGGYIFIHRMLMEHFAQMELEK